MRAIRIRELERLQRDLQGDGYTVAIKTRSSPNLLLFVVTLKDGDEEQLLKAWDKVRRTE